jgi:hypothetical protein
VARAARYCRDTHLTDNPFSAGQFVWCAYPEWEHPLQPGPRHIGYIFAALAVRGSPAAIVAYTTSQPWPDALPPAVYPFTVTEAEGMGQDRAFVLDARRLAFIPVIPAWFPDLGEPTQGVVGSVSDQLRDRIEADLKRLLRRSPDSVQRLGSLWT